MTPHVCPWLLGYWLASPLRRWWLKPQDIVGPFVKEGQIVLEPGPGMGFFTLDLARLVGTSGRVIAVDIQPKMLEGLKRRAAKAGYLDRIDARLASAESLGIGEYAGAIDFTLACATVHEFPAPRGFFQQAAIASKKDAKLLLIEPKGHVKEPAFESEVQAAIAAGFQLVDRPMIRSNHAALLKKL